MGQIPTETIQLNSVGAGLAQGVVDDEQALEKLHDLIIDGIIDLQVLLKKPTYRITECEVVIVSEGWNNPEGSAQGQLPVMESAKAQLAASYPDVRLVQLHSK